MAKHRNSKQKRKPYASLPKWNWIKVWANKEERKKKSPKHHSLEIIGCIIEEPFHFDQFIFIHHESQLCTVAIKKTRNEKRRWCRRQRSTIKAIKCKKDTPVYTHTYHTKKDSRRQYAQKVAFSFQKIAKEKYIFLNWFESLVAAAWQKKIYIYTVCKVLTIEIATTIRTRTGRHASIFLSKMFPEQNIVLNKRCLDVIKVSALCIYKYLWKSIEWSACRNLLRRRKSN